MLVGCDYGLDARWPLWWMKERKIRQTDTYILFLFLVYLLCSIHDQVYTCAGNSYYSTYSRPLLTVRQNRQGKTRLSKWYVPYDDDEKVEIPLTALTKNTENLCRFDFEEKFIVWSHLGTRNISRISSRFAMMPDVLLFFQ